MLPDRVSNPGPLTYESGALPIALRGPAQGVGNYMFAKKCVSFSKKPRQKSQISLHSNFIFNNIEHTILGIMQFFFLMDSVEQGLNFNAISIL